MVIPKVNAGGNTILRGAVEGIRNCVPLSYGSNFIGVIKVIIVVSMCKSRRMRWVGRAACMAEKRCMLCFCG